MPRIREYTGFGVSDADDEGAAQRHRAYRMPEVKPADEPEGEETDSAEQSEAAKAEPAAQVEKPATVVAVKTAEASAPIAEKPAAEPAQTETARVSGTINKIVIPEKNLTPKYTDAGRAVDSVMDGEFYEDYERGCKADLIKSKEFVLTVIAQSPSRFYSPQTPKPAEWIDEEYLCERAARFFEETKESVKPAENAGFSADLYDYLRKSAFSPEGYATLSSVLKRVAKVAAACVTSPEDVERMRASLDRFHTAVNSAMGLVRDKHAAALAAEAARREKLAQYKKELAERIDGMNFEF